MNKMNVGYTLFYNDGEMNLNYFQYSRNGCIREIVAGYGETWRSLKKQGFSVGKIKAQRTKGADK